ncbi:hypothetical protein Q5P01_021111 [Channa striata]|uniref:Uncharacterized protein n=1 Tax=Channa striata TaxID=64152 RepID=A0AA88LTR1_CHASR|nr:hypothetical protein Q5P01_021111 [Channa striata]
MLFESTSPESCYFNNSLQLQRKEGAVCFPACSPRSLPAWPCCLVNPSMSFSLSLHNWPRQVYTAREKGSVVEI